MAIIFCRESGLKSEIQFLHAGKEICAHKANSDSV